MATMFGRFEIQSELSNSDTALIYKALDLKTEQVVVLKTQSLERLGDAKDAFVTALLNEGESARTLANQNIVPLFGAGEIDNQFCAAMEYIQGNSIATMLSHDEGFSIWDLIDISRQVCAALEHAAAKGVTHSSLEPAKIMVQWDGMVKVLGYGISNMSLINAESGQGLGRLMPYCSPEQIRGEGIDLRSNLFTLGTILYEMVAGRKAFDAADPVELVQQIENGMPQVPASLNGKVHPVISALIMKALAKDPAERYQTGHELVDDLERCKENGKKAADPVKSAPVPNTVANRAARAAASSKFVSAASTPASTAPANIPPKPPSRDQVAPTSTRAHAPTLPNPPSSKLSAAAAAGVSGRASSASSSNFSNSPSNSGARLISDLEKSTLDSLAASGPVLSSALEKDVERPRVAVDPLMSEPNSGPISRLMTGPLSEPETASSGKSFSDLAEMPPLKQAFAAPSIPEPAEPAPVAAQPYRRKEPTPGKPREVAQKAIHQIATVPPKLILFSTLGAVGLILIVVIAVYFHIRSVDDGSTPAPQQISAANENSAATAVQPTGNSGSSAKNGNETAPVLELQPRLSVRPAEKRSAKNTARAPILVPEPAAQTGEALVDSNPQGASLQVDGQSDPAWVTPFTLANLSPGKHIISVSKPGYSSDIRSIEVAFGSKVSLQFVLASVNALVVVSSTPPGADILIDGKPMRRVTPAQFAVEKGSHTVLLRKQGYLDETVTADLGPAQNFQYSPVLKALGNTEDMHTMGALNRLFGRGPDSVAGMASIVIRTRPKGAQVSINQHILDKTSPVGVAVGAGNYIVDITLTGFQPIHKIVTIDKGSRAEIDEVLERQ